MVAAFFFWGDEDRAVREVDQPVRRMAEKQMRRDMPKMPDIEIEKEQEAGVRKQGEGAEKCVCCHKAGLI